MINQPAGRFGFVAPATGAIALGFLLWLGMHWPLFPKTPAGWAAAILSYAVVVVACLLIFPVLSWSEREGAFERLRIVLGAIVACSLGVGIFVAEWLWRDFIASNFQRM